MIGVYIIAGIIILCFPAYVLWRLFKLRLTWNEHKSLMLKTYKISSKMLHELNRKQDKQTRQIEELDRKLTIKTRNIENTLNSIQYEMLLEQIERIAQNFRDQKKITEKTYNEFKKLLHDNKMDNRIKELLKKK